MFDQIITSHPLRCLSQRGSKRDYKVQFTEEKQLSVDWSRAEEWKSISLVETGAASGVSDQAGDLPWDSSCLLTAPVYRPVLVYESLGSLMSTEPSFLALMSQVK